MPSWTIISKDSKIDWLVVSLFRSICTFRNRLLILDFLLAIHQLALLADGPAAEPTLTQYNQFGQRVDTLRTSEGWRALKRVSAVEGLVAEGFERKHEEFSRVTSFAKVSSDRAIWIRVR